MALSFYLNGAACNPPENWQELQIELSFENNSPAASVNATSFDFVGAEADTINTWLNLGLSGSAGITEGIPFQIKACQNTTIFDGVLDLTAESNMFECDRCTVALKETNKIDWLTDVADSFSFAYLASIGLITKSNYVAVPYVINTVPNYTQAAITSVTILMIESQIYYTILELTDIVNKISLGGSSALATAGITSAQFLGYLLEFTLLLAYLIGLIVSFIVLIDDLIEYLIQPLKYKYGMKVQDLFSIACTHLGLGFSSSILQNSVYKDLIIIPQKYTIKESGSYRDKPSEDENAESYGYYDGTFGDLIRAMNDVFNAKVTIKAGVLYFERYDYFQNLSTYTLPDIVLEPYQTNASELAANYFLTFAVDSEDLNTYDTWNKTNAQCIFSQNVVTTTQKNVMLKGLNEIQLSFAQAKRKEDYTLIETLMQGVCDLFYILYSGIYASVDIIIGAINYAVNLIGWSSTVTNTLPQGQTWLLQKREGAMLLDNEYIGIPKLLLGDANVNVATIPVQPSGVVVVKYLSFVNSIFVNAYFLLMNYHAYSFWQDSTLNIHNQYLKYKNKEIPFCCIDYISMLNSNWCITADGKQAKVQRLVWTPENDEAIIDIDVKEKYTNNLKQRIIVDGVYI